LHALRRQRKGAGEVGYRDASVVFLRPVGRKGRTQVGGRREQYPGAGGMGRGPGVRVWVVEVGHPTPQDLRVMENRSCRGRGRRRRFRSHVTYTHTYVYDGNHRRSSSRPGAPWVGGAVGRQRGGREDRHNETQSARGVLGGNGAVLRVAYISLRLVGLVGDSGWGSARGTP
jgi:hypothetical protein